MQRISPRQAARIRYKLYESALSSGIDSDTYHAVVTEGFFDNLLKKIASKFKKKGKGSDAAEDPDVEKVYATAGEEIKTAIKKLFDISAQKKLPRDQTLEWVKAFVDSILKETQASAPEAGSGGGGGGESGGGTGGGATQTVSSTDTSTPAVQATGGAAVTGRLAAVAGTDPTQAVQNASENEVPVSKLIDKLAKTVSKVAGTDTAATRKIIDHLWNKDLFESRSRSSRRSLLLMIESTSRRLSDRTIMERWQHLAGINLRRGLLAEAAGDPSMVEILTKFQAVKTPDDVRDVLPNLEKSELDHILKNIGQFYQELGELGQKNETPIISKDYNKNALKSDVEKAIKESDSAEGGKLGSKGIAALKSVISNKIVDDQNLAKKVISILFSTKAEEAAAAAQAAANQPAAT